MKYKTKTRSLIVVMIVAPIVLLSASIFNTGRQINRAHRLASDPNCVEIRYYTTSSEIHFTRNNDTDIFTTLNKNIVVRNPFEILRERLKKEDWLFNFQTEENAWRGIKIPSPSQN